MQGLTAVEYLSLMKSATGAKRLVPWHPPYCHRMNQRFSDAKSDNTVALYNSLTCSGRVKKMSSSKDLQPHFALDNHSWLSPVLLLLQKRLFYTAKVMLITTQLIPLLPTLIPTSLPLPTCLHINCWFYSNT